MNLIEHFRHARKVLSVPAGEAIFREGDSGTVMYVLLDGEADIVVGEAPIERAGPGTLVGEMALVDISPRSASLVARTDCRLLPIEPREFDLLIRETPEFARHVMSVMADRLRRMNERMKEGFGEVTVPLASLRAGHPAQSVT
jgi:CRP/FNR family transcriptional regulator, cyclic AMP receptor protein